MMPDTLPRLQPLGVVDLLDLALRLYRQHLRVLLGITALVYGPLLALQSVFGALVLTPLASDLTRVGGDPEAAQSALLALCGAYAAFLGALLLVAVPAAAFTSGALSRAVAQAYLGEPPSIGAAARFVLARRRWLSLAIASVLLSLAYIPLALIPCIGWFGAIYVALRLAVLPQVVVLESRGPIEGMRRTWELAEGHLLRLLGMSVVAFGVVSVISFGVGQVADTGVVLAAGPLGLSPPVRYLVQSGVASVVQIILQPITAIALTLFYYDLRIRREGLDLSLRAQRIAAEAPPA
jgi:hypothetical protein